MTLSCDLLQMNMEKNEPISFDKWHYPYLTDIVNLQEDYFDWIENKVRREGRRRGEEEGGGVTSQPSSPG